MSINENEWSAFFEELEKIAVDTRTLMANAARAGNVHIRPTMLSNATEGAGTIATAAQQATPGYIARMDAMFRNRPFARMQVDSFNQANAGTIGVDPNLLGPSVARQLEVPPPTPAGNYGVAAIGAGHELAERAVHPSNVVPVYSHMSPGVLANDRRLMDNLAGPGSVEGRQLMEQARRTTGEFRFLDSTTEAAFPQVQGRPVVFRGQPDPNRPNVLVPTGATKRYYLNWVRNNPQTVQRLEARTDRWVARRNARRTARNNSGNTGGNTGGSNQTP